MMSMDYLELLKLCAPETIVVVTALVAVDVGWGFHGEASLRVPAVPTKGRSQRRVRAMLSFSAR